MVQTSKVCVWPRRPPWVRIPPLPPFLRVLICPWLSLVERSVRDGKVGGSNPLGQTIFHFHNGSVAERLMAAGLNPVGPKGPVGSNPTASSSFTSYCPGVAQPDRAIRSGRIGRRFESSHLDQIFIVVAVAQLVEHRTVTAGVAGSSPVGHPISSFLMRDRLAGRARDSDSRRVGSKPAPASKFFAAATRPLCSGLLLGAVARL